MNTQPQSGGFRTPDRWNSVPIPERVTHMVLAHRAAWVHVNGQMPMGMTLDHTCKSKPCVNPSHLRVLPNFENARRIGGKNWPKGQCANGHTFAH